MPKRAKRRARPASCVLLTIGVRPQGAYVWSLSPSVGRRPIRAVYGTCSSRSCACTKKHWRGWLSAYRKPVCAPFRQRQNKQRIKPMTNVQRSRRQVRLSRALGIALTPKAQRIFEKRPYAPGEHGRTRRRTESDYAVRLREKQRLRAQYGISEKQLRAAYEKGTHTAGQTGNAMLIDLETRLDALVLRAASPAPRSGTSVRGSPPHPR